MYGTPVTFLMMQKKNKKKRDSSVVVLEHASSLNHFHDASITTLSGDIS